MPQCQDPEFVAGLLELADLRPGNPTDSEQVAAGEKRLRRLGLFRDVRIACTPTAGAVDVGVAVAPATRLRHVEVEGNEHFYGTAVMDRLTIQPGDVLEPGDPETAELLDRVRDTVRRMYRDDGYNGTTVTAEVLPGGHPDRGPPESPNEVDLVIRIVEGERLKIESLDLSLKPARETPAPPRGAEACPDVRVRDLREFADVALGQSYTERTIPDAVRRLTRALRGIGFTHVRVNAAFDPATRRLELAATYDACYLLRFFVRDAEAPGRLGFEPFADPALIDALPFGDSGVFDLTEASIAREEVRTFFENRGHLLADVVLDHRTRDSGEAPGPGYQGRPWAAGVAGILSYYVTRNAHVEIRGIRFRGNDTIPDESLLAVMSTKPYDFFGDPGVVIPDQVVYDLDRIEKLYRDEGFAEVRFAGTRLGAGRVRVTSQDGPDTVYTYHVGDRRVFQVRRPPLTEGVYLEIGIEEGPRRTLGEVSVRGSAALTPEEAAATAGLEAGGPFSPTRVREAASALVRRLSSLGFLSVAVKVTCRGHDPEVERERCDPDTVASRIVDVDVEVSDGLRTHVGAVFVAGTRRTADSVIAREFPKPGEPYDVEEMAASIRRLKDLGIFSSVQITTVGADEKPPHGSVGVVVNCREARSRFLDIAGGVETLNRSLDLPAAVASPLATTISLTDRSTTSFGRVLGLQIPDILVTAEVRYTDQNFLGRAKRLYLPFKYGLSATAWDRYASFTPTYVDPRFFARGLTFRFTPFAIYDRATTRLDLIQFGTELAVSKELVERLFGSLSVEVAGVTSRDSEVASDYSPFRLETKVVPSLTYDRLDNPINPQKGGFLQASLSYINAITRDGGANNYLKWEISGKLFWSVRNIVTFGVMARYGASMSFGGQTMLPDEERFTLGGNRGVRGFSNDAIAQYNADGSLRLAPVVNEQGVVVKRKPYGGDIVLNATAEARFVLLRKINLYGAVFYDVGALAERVVDLNVGSVRSSVGFGLRLLLGGTIPIRLDYGVILDRRCKDADPLTGACVQREEVGNIHFGILYTF
jgi:outer membrane protein assembly factor BamA